jgi:LacI family transcriptional regulator
MIQRRNEVNMVSRKKRKKPQGFHVTLESIAERLRVSKVTVSKALRGHPDISAETAMEIKRVARELGYYPNYMARNLSSRKSNTIGVIVPKLAHAFFSAVIEGIYDAAFQHNYEIILTVSQENDERELRHINSLLSMRVDGLIISLSQQTKDYSVFNTIKKMGIPLTFMDRVPRMDGFDTVVADDRGGAFAVVEHAINIGYTKIAHLAGYQHTSIGRDRYKGFVDAMNKYGIRINNRWVVYGGFDESSGYKGVKALYETGDLPEMIFAVTFPVALGVYRATQELGLKIPDDTDLICFGNSGLNQFLSPPLSYVEQPTLELGRRAFELTLERIQKKDQVPLQHIKLPVKLVLCRTCTEKVAAPKKRK